MVFARPLLLVSGMRITLAKIASAMVNVPGLEFSILLMYCRYDDEN
jgi:hypothetical protein